MNFNLNHSKYLAKLDKLFPPISWFQMLHFVDDLDEPLEGLSSDIYARVYKHLLLLHSQLESIYHAEQILKPLKTTQENEHLMYLTIHTKIFVDQDCPYHFAKNQLSHQA